MLGPEYPLVSRIRGFYNKQFLLKIENSASFSKAKPNVEFAFEKSQEFIIPLGMKKFRDMFFENYEN